MDREDQKDLLESVIGSAAIDTGSFRFPKAEVLADMFSLAENICVPNPGDHRHALSVS